MFTVELTRGQDHAVVVKTIPLNVPNIGRAIEGARALLDDEGDGADGYLILNDSGQSVARNWTGYPHA